MDSQETARRVGLALSTASDPALAAAWADGFLRGSGVVLIHDAELFSVVDQWVQFLTEDAFTQILPLLRRTFSSYNPAERRQIGERAKSSRAGGARLAAKALADFDEARGERVLPVLAQILGLGSEVEAK
jgi:hypothetical protein